jgi:hypothetical protein
MSQGRLNSIVGFYDVSVIIPLVGSHNRFLKTLDSSQVFFRQNGIEVIIAAENDSVEIRSGYDMRSISTSSGPTPIPV